MNTIIKKIYVSFLVTTIIAIGLGTDAYGGLIMEQIRYEKGSDQKEKGIIYISNNKIKAIQEKGSGVVIFDLNTGEMIQVDNDNKRYVVAKPDEMRSALEVQISKLPPEQRAIYIKELEKIKRAAGGDSNQDDEETVFKQIYESGFPMRSVDYSSGSSVFVEEIVKVTTANVPEIEFHDQRGYKKVTLQEMMSLE